MSYFWEILALLFTMKIWCSHKNVDESLLQWYADFILESVILDSIRSVRYIIIYIRMKMNPLFRSWKSMLKIMCNTTCIYIYIGFRQFHHELNVHWENYISISFRSEWDMIVVTDFEPNGNSIWFKNCHRDHIPFTVKGNGNIVFSVYM